MGTPRLELGTIVQTPGVRDLDPSGAQVNWLLQRHAAGDWGSVPPDDAEQNEAALRERGMVMSKYEVNGEPIWIITDHGHTVTTVLLPSEY
jgi:hypothetical protein